MCTFIRVSHMIQQKRLQVEDEHESAVRPGKPKMGTQNRQAATGRRSKCTHLRSGCNNRLDAAGDTRVGFTSRLMIHAQYTAVVHSTIRTSAPARVCVRRTCEHVCTYAPSTPTRCHGNHAACTPPPHDPHLRKPQDPWKETAAAAAPSIDQGCRCRHTHAHIDHPASRQGTQTPSTT